MRLPSLRTRRSARVLLLDGQDRLLLFRNEDMWFTPGGGVERAESLPQAAARELAEETGLAVTPDTLGPAVAWTGGWADLDWRRGWFEDVFFLHRVRGHAVDTSGFLPHETATMTRHHWWTVPELGRTTERVVPLGVVPLLNDLIKGERPAKPVQLPWHH